MDRRPAFVAFRCVGCAEVREIADLDRHARSGGRICSECVQHTTSVALRLIDRYGLPKVVATEAVSRLGAFGAEEAVRRAVRRRDGMSDAGASSNLALLTYRDGYAKEARGFRELYPGLIAAA